MKIRELIVDLYGCVADLNNSSWLTSVLESAAKEMGSTIVKTVSHNYSPIGITVILLLAETHISIHTWPQYKYAALDVFICSDEADPETAWNVVKAALKPASSKTREIHRQVT
ncbi:MAG: adenosylmethionine decarboxylase [Candidatus Bathyarchaeota archaeon]|nr:MAG: adenosylmethionine decarboxylase [Candidatus Bathyarchaeota archaeon]